MSGDLIGTDIVVDGCTAQGCAGSVHSAPGHGRSQPPTCLMSGIRGLNSFHACPTPVHTPSGGCTQEAAGIGVQGKAVLSRVSATNCRAPAAGGAAAASSPAAQVTRAVALRAHAAAGVGGSSESKLFIHLLRGTSATSSSAEGGDGRAERLRGVQQRRGAAAPVGGGPRAGGPRAGAATGQKQRQRQSRRCRPRYYVVVVDSLPQGVSADGRKSCDGLVGGAVCGG